jgi:hypothetical protein
MPKFLFLILLLINTLCFSQSQEPLQKNTVEKLKKHSELWYADQKFSPDSAEIVYDSLVANGKIIKPKKKDAVKRDTIPDQLNIPEWLFTALKWVFYLGILVAIIFLIIKGNFRMFSTATNTELNNEITENTTIESASQLQNIGFEQQIAAAETQGNFRLAVRLHYLWVIKRLVNKGLIRFHIKKTNVDYCNELIENQHFEEFKNCTKYYNYVWFGEFVIDAEKYQNIKSIFNQFLTKI